MKLKNFVLCQRCQERYNKLLAKQEEAEHLRKEEERKYITWKQTHGLLKRPRKRKP
jgi:hypothetical protein